MLPGPILIKKCSKCSGLIKQHTLSSGNTFEAKFWTDGQMNAPMMPEYLLLVKCPHCKKLIWINEQEKIDHVSFFSDDNWESESESDKNYPQLTDRSKAKYKDAMKVQIPTADDYYMELKEGHFSTEKESYIRTQALRRSNDRRRNSNVKYELLDYEKQNMYALAEILDEHNDEQRLLKAEIKRELGDFEGAFALLEKTFDSQFIETVLFIKKLVRDHITEVTEIKFEE